MPWETSDPIARIILDDFLKCQLYQGWPRPCHWWWAWESSLATRTNEATSKFTPISHYNHQHIRANLHKTLSINAITKRRKITVTQDFIVLQSLAPPNCTKKHSIMCILEINNRKTQPLKVKLSLYYQKKKNSPYNFFFWTMNYERGGGILNERLKVGFGSTDFDGG